LRLRAGSRADRCDCDRQETKPIETWLARHAPPPMPGIRLAAE
jgi:hypothetical protein